MKLEQNLLKAIFLLVISLASFHLNAQSDLSAQDTLYNEILRMDSLLFEIGFNKCDLEMYKSIMNKNLEFYDDRQGLSVSTDSVNTEGFRNRCSKPFKVRRELVSTEIYPLKSYGAVQLGVHRFYVDGVLEEHAKFVHIWQKKDHRWFMTRAISYDHKPVE